MTSTAAAIRSCSFTPAGPALTPGVIPGTSHGLLVEKPALCNTIIAGFLTTDPVPTRAPIRRA